MTDLQKLQAGLMFAAGILVLAAIGVAWLAYAQYPTAANFRKATLLTLGNL